MVFSSSASRVIAITIAGLLAHTSHAWAQSARTCPHAGALFCSDFEEADIDANWGQNVRTRAEILTAAGPSNRAGNHVARLRAPAARVGADIYKVLSAGQKRLYARWYQQWEPGHDFDASCHGFTFHGQAGDDPTACMGCSDNRPRGDDFFSAWLEPCGDDRRLHYYAYYRGMYMDCANPVGACWGDHFPCLGSDNYCTKPEYKPQPGKLPPQLETGRWYCIEGLIDAGTPTSSQANADGLLDFWIDGVEYGPFAKLWLRTSPNVLLKVFWLGIWHHGEHSVEGIMVDDAVASTSRIGCLTSPSTKLPSAPTNLRVVAD